MNARWVMPLILLTFAAGSLSATPSKPLEPLRLIDRLAALGPRPAGPGSAHREAKKILLAEMRAIGLSRVQSEPSSVPSRGLNLDNLTALVPGRGRGEIVLSAHYDSVPAGPGADDDASGCAVVLRAAEKLVQLRLRHRVRVILFDGEEEGMLGSRAWLASRTPSQRDEILADLNVEMVGWKGSAGPVVVSFPRRRGALRSWAPAWLVRDALEKGDLPGWRLSFLDPHWSLAAQIVLHASRVAFGTDNDRFVDLGIPAVFFSASSESSFDPNYHTATDLPSSLDGARLERWADFLAALATRVDRLKRRPPWSPTYFVVDGWLLDRTWLLILMLLALSPVSLRLFRAAGDPLLGRGRILALCVVAFSLAALALAPVLAPWLLAPAALAVAFTRGGRRFRWLLATAASAPLVLLWAAVLVATFERLARGWGLPLHTTLVFTAAVGCAMAAILEVEWDPETRAQRLTVL